MADAARSACSVYLEPNADSDPRKQQYVSADVRSQIANLGVQLPPCGHRLSNDQLLAVVEEQRALIEHLRWETRPSGPRTARLLSD